MVSNGEMLILHAASQI